MVLQAGLDTIVYNPHTSKCSNSKGVDILFIGYRKKSTVGK